MAALLAAIDVSRITPRRGWGPRMVAVASALASAKTLMPGTRPGMTAVPHTQARERGCGARSFRALPRHGRAWPAHPRLRAVRRGARAGARACLAVATVLSLQASSLALAEAWMAGTRPAMTLVR